MYLAVNLYAEGRGGGGQERLKAGTSIHLNIFQSHMEKTWLLANHSPG